MPFWLDKIMVQTVYRRVHTLRALAIGTRPTTIFRHCERVPRNEVRGTRSNLSICLEASFFMIIVLKF